MDLGVQKVYLWVLIFLMVVVLQSLVWTKFILPKAKLIHIQYDNY